MQAVSTRHSECEVCRILLGFSVSHSRIDDMTLLKDFIDAQRTKDNALAHLLREADATEGLTHTPGEIAQQPWLWKETAKRMHQHAEPLRRFLHAAGLYADHCRPAIALTGAGTSDYVGLSVADMLRGSFKTASYNWPTTRITAFPDAFFQAHQEYVVVHFARSGDSPESGAVLELALRHFPENTRHVVITCNPLGALAALARKHPDSVYLVVLHEACNDRGLAMTSSFTNMVVAGQALAYLEDMETFTDLIERTAEAAAYLVDTHVDTIKELADIPVQRVFYLGNVDQLGAAVESALKTQELTAGMVTAAGEDTLALRHGPVSAVDPESMVCFYLSANDYTRRYELDVLRQYQLSFDEMGTQTVVVGSHQPEDAPDSDVRYITYDPDDRWQIPTFHQVNLSVLFGQLYGLFACHRRALNVDNPAAHKSLYSRTVRGVNLYEFEPSDRDGR